MCVYVKKIMELRAVFDDVSSLDVNFVKYLNGEVLTMVLLEHDCSIVAGI